MKEMKENKNYLMESKLLLSRGRPCDVVAREAVCYAKNPGFESWVRHGYQTVRPWSHQWLRSKTGRREVVYSSVSLVDLVVRNFL